MTTSTTLLREKSSIKLTGKEHEFKLPPQTPRFDESTRFLELSYGELEKRNLELKKLRGEKKSQEFFKDLVLNVLKSEPMVKAVTLCFSDLEGKLHMLDYNKKYLLESYENLTFDGSSIKGFTPQNCSDLRLHPDWTSFRWLPADVFGAGKVLMFGNVFNQEGSPYNGDYRSNLMLLAEELYKEQKIVVHVAPEIEGFILKGENAEQHFDERAGFELASEGGYFNVLPQDQLRKFIDRLAEATRALAFENEKDHPEVAPSQFEMNYKYTDILHAADQVQLYKVIARQIAKNFGFTACFLPKPTMKINGSGMHTNISLNQNGENIFYDAKGKFNLSQKAHDFFTGILYHANDICLALNPSVNAYRRLDPKFEAPNEIKMSANDRGSMIRIPLGNKRSARIEIRSIAPDANPYLTFFIILKAGLNGLDADEKTLQNYYHIYSKPVKKLPNNIYQAINLFKRSEFIKKTMTKENREKYIHLKENSAARCPRDLGTRVKAGEVWYHHEVTNQVLWNRF
ncbi:glutamine synthetase [Candidatus Peregrinibacteria bacterium]|nr:glutamine synthetase [Candidatus Peregrinibacteria bacterium]